MAEIGVQNLQKRFGEFVAVRESSFTIHGGEFFVMLGPSGCGKTTTLRMIAGLELPTSGQILIDGDDVTPLRASRRDVAFMFQLFALYPHMNVHDNIALPPEVPGGAAQGTPPPRRGDRGAAPHRPLPPPAGVRARGRRPPAGGPGPRHRAPGRRRS